MSASRSGPVADETVDRMVDGSGDRAAGRATDEVAPRVSPTERSARAAWSALAEPGDPVAGALVGALGAHDALELVSIAADRGVAAAWRATTDAVVGPSGASLARLSRAVERWRLRLADARSRRVGEHVREGIRLVVPGDDEWPEQLDELGDAAPFALWVRGGPVRGLAARSVAVVGARASTTYGERVAHDLAVGLAQAGVITVSGGAYGIDAAAHRGALSGATPGGTACPTLVLLAGGVDRAYPAGNARLFEAVVAGGGAIVSEVPPGSLPTKSRFLQRNRLIAASSRATVVVEAAWRSGAISTANHAARLLRPVGAVPGPVTSVASAGCHRLLREGVAVCVTDADEVVELVGPVGASAVVETGDVHAQDELDPGARRVLDALARHRPATVERVAALAGVDLRAAHGALGLLELSGHAQRSQDGWRLGVR
ncbi:DNA-processing protein DprA [Cellulomonas sp. HZM]|uniref:DNA-processing protein DprA n=1 Tax=Cellulomonas sp. HZM TaxID=1454010 RepID=UPI0009DE13E8|nr:DNA-processing protein DprA [Cellulomonas sp. HZM]